MARAERNQGFGVNDVLVIAAIILSGVVGFLTLTKSPLAIFALPIYTWVFIFCFFGLFAVCTYQAASGRAKHRFAGLVIGLSPILCPLLGWSGWQLFKILTE